VTDTLSGCGDFGVHDTLVHNDVPHGFDPGIVDMDGVHVSLATQCCAQDSTVYHHVPGNIELCFSDLAGDETGPLHPESVLYHPVNRDFPLVFHVACLEVHVAGDDQFWQYGKLSEDGELGKTVDFRNDLSAILGDLRARAAKERHIPGFFDGISFPYTSIPGISGIRGIFSARTSPFFTWESRPDP